MSRETDDLVATPSQTVGPFFHVGLCVENGGPSVFAEATANKKGAPARLVIRVTDGDGTPIPDALIELWSAAGFARVPTRDDGSCELAIAASGAGYLNLCVFARGLLRHLQTRVYFGDSRTDEVLARVPEARRHTLFATSDGAGRWRFDLRLQGDDETVFFDV